MSYQILYLQHPLHSFRFHHTSLSYPLFFFSSSSNIIVSPIRGALGRRYAFSIPEWKVDDNVVSRSTATRAETLTIILPSVQTIEEGIEVFNHLYQVSNSKYNCEGGFLNVYRGTQKTLTRLLHNEE